MIWIALISENKFGENSILKLLLPHWWKQCLSPFSLGFSNFSQQCFIVSHVFHILSKFISRYIKFFHAIINGNFYIFKKIKELYFIAILGSQQTRAPSTTKQGQLLFLAPSHPVLQSLPSVNFHWPVIITWSLVYRRLHLGLYILRVLRKHVVS